MHKYNIADFCRYYTGSWLLHPREDKIVRVIAASRKTADAVLLSDKSEALLSELDWKHVMTPPLGYRSLNDGKILYYVERRAIRSTEKGVTPAAISINVPNIVRSLCRELGVDSDYADLMKHAQLEQKLASVIFKPEFKHLPEAVDLLRKKSHAIGFALSNNWAITLGLYKEHPYLLHFKNSRVASSVDGHEWKFTDTDAQFVFERSSLR